MKVTLTAEEIAYLGTAHFVAGSFAERLKQASTSVDRGSSFEISADDADSLRDLLGEELQREGFDASYNLTDKGKLLEGLIDKFLGDRSQC